MPKKFPGLKPHRKCLELYENQDSGSTFHIQTLKEVLRTLLLYICSLDLYGVKISFAPTVDKEFTLQEIDSAIKHLKSGKATGSDDIRNEYISYEKRQLKPVLKLLFNEIYDTGIYPEQWSSGIIIPIYKKGTREDPSNYRGITLTGAMSTLFTYMLNQRINDWSEESGILS